MSNQYIFKFVPDNNDPHKFPQNGTFSAIDLIGNLNPEKNGTYMMTETNLYLKSDTIQIHAKYTVKNEKTICRAANKCFIYSCTYVFDKPLYLTSFGSNPCTFYQKCDMDIPDCAIKLLSYVSQNNWKITCDCDIQPLVDSIHEEYKNRVDFFTEMKEKFPNENFDLTNKDHINKLENKLEEDETTTDEVFDKIEKLYSFSKFNKLYLEMLKEL